MIRSTLTIALICMASAASLAEDPDFSAELPRIAPTPPDKAIDTFVVKEGYKIELAAAEPLVASPVAICWDERGRMYVVEMRGYSEHRDEKLSRVRVLSDDNDDGVYDRSTIFAADLLWPTAIACWDGGVFVADAPDILYLKDTDGDGQADVRRRVFTGFGVQNVQGLLNSFHWGLDNRIQGSASSNGGSITVVDKPDVKPVVVNGRDFSFDPRTLDFRTESGGAQHGMTFDDFGHKFVCSNSDHCQQVMFEDRYVARNPLLAAPSARVSIATDGPQAEVFRASPVEPWRIVRTRLRVAGAVPGPIEGGGRAAGYFTGATGITMVRGSAFVGDPMYGMVVVGDVGSNLIHRKKLTLEGVQYKAERIDTESEFVASKDNWFRPAQFANGPDGALYVIDVYREVIEHPASLPPVIKKHLDLDSGRDRGRIWRISPKDSVRHGVETLHKKNTRELVARLDYADAWTRETAARLLYERQDMSSVEPLRKLARTRRQGILTRGPAQALYTLAGLGQLQADDLVQTPAELEHVLRLAELHLDSAAVRKRITSVSNLIYPQAEYRRAFVLGGLPLEERIPPLLKVISPIRTAGLLGSPIEDDPWTRYAALNSLGEGAGRALVELQREHSRERLYRVFKLPLLNGLAEQVGRRADKNDCAAVLQANTRLSPRQQMEWSFIFRSMERGAKAQGTSLAAILGPEHQSEYNRWQETVVKEAVRVASDRENADESERYEATQALAIAGFAEAFEPLVALMSPQQPATIQLVAVQTIGEFAEPKVAAALIERWQSFTPEVRRAAIALLLDRPERTAALIDAIDSKTLAASELDSSQRARLSSHPSQTIRDGATRLFGALARRNDVIEQYRPVLEKPGDAARGKELFAKNC